MMNKTLLSFGHGYTARALAAELLAEGWQITGTTRSAVAACDAASYCLGGVQRACPVADELLRRTNDPNVDFCTVCKKEVFLVHDEAEMDRRAEAGECVTYDPAGTLRKRNEKADKKAIRRLIPGPPPEPPRRGARLPPSRRPWELPPEQFRPLKPLKKPPKSATKTG